MLRSVALVRTEVSEELSASFIRVTRISELAVTSNRCTLRRNTKCHLHSDVFHDVTLRPRARTRYLSLAVTTIHCPSAQLMKP
jgi:hypothetical protein